MDNEQAFSVLAEHLAVLPIEAHLADDLIIIEHCRSYLNDALRFWNDHRGKVSSVEALTTILSYDYHQIMKTGSRELRHLMNIYELNQIELEQVRQGLHADSSLDTIDNNQLIHLNEQGYAVVNELSQYINSTITELENSLAEIKKSSIKLWDKSPISKSVIPKDLNFFISHATKDKELAVAICKELESVGISTWRDDKDIVGGDSIPTEIAKGLETASHFGLLYSETSKDRPWVKTEFENALMLRERTGRPRIIPLLLNELKPPTMLGNIKGISFENFDDAMEFLWRSLGVPAGSRVSLDTIFKFQQRAHKALTNVKDCNQTEYQSLEIYDDTFDELEDIESYALSFPIQTNEIRRRCFEWTMVSFSGTDRSDVRPCHEWNFYTYRRGAIAGATLLRTMNGIARRLLAILEDVEDAPLPPEIADSA